MKPVWKWIIGILAALLLLSVLGMPLMMAWFYARPGGSPGQPWGWYMPMHPGFGGWPMMGGGWGFGGLLSILIQVGLLVLIVLAIIWMVRAINRQDRKDN